ncbi:MAG TPA: serine/threonine-protein kinase [Thermoanaerobaculia bacterium]|nr:serine/threonine-protein kinase [Thermoanaerobaculia bacterium]
MLAPEIEATYEVLAKMGEGGMGAVYKVRHKFFDEVRVIKVMHAQLIATESIQERFLSEAKRGKQFRHPNLAEVLDVSIAADGTSYMVMEYIEGINLREVLARNGGPLDYRIVVAIAEQALDALGYLHSRKFVHRDISPDNLMLAREGDAAPRVKLIDLGIAKSLDTTHKLTMAGKFLGKVKYAPPEQFSGEVDARSDLYSLGVVLYELLTGTTPITGKDNMSIIAGVVTRPPRDFAETDPAGLVPPRIRAAVMKSLEKNPDHRFATAAEFSDALQAAVAPEERRTLEQQIFTEPAVELPAARTEVTGTRSKSWLHVAIIAAPLLIGAVVTLWLTTRKPDIVPTDTAPTLTNTGTSGTTVAVEVPVEVAVETGQLLINALPWGEVTSVKNADGEEQLTSGNVDTPLMLSLPVGDYKVSLANPNSQRSVVLDAKVSANVVTRCEAELDRVDADAYVEGLGIGK